MTSKAANHTQMSETPVDVKSEASLSVLGRMRDMARTREIPRSQSEVLALAVLKYNLLMRGPAGMGKRWIARHAGHILALRGEKVEIMSKWFTITPQGQIMIDGASLPVAVEQIRRATVLIIENVPCHPQAAAAFFAHLDFICRIERCKTYQKAQITKDAALKQFNGECFSMDGPEQSSFGGLQILATQNDTTETEPSPTANNQVLWTTPASATAAVAGNASGSGPSGQTAASGRVTQLGLVVSQAAPVAGNPHSEVFVLLFR